MKDDPVDQIIVNAIIGDIRQVPDWDDDEEVEITDEEIAEFDALTDADMPKLSQESLDRMIAAGMDCFNWFVYKQAMEERNLPYVDIYEWRNMNPRPQVTS